NQLVIVAVIVEVEHVVDRSSLRVVGVAADTAEVPVVFDKTKNGGLIRDGVIHIVVARERRNDDERQARAVAAAAGNGAIRRCAAHADTRESIFLNVRLVDDGIHLVVVPAIGIIVRNDDRGGVPSRALLNRI